MTRGGSTERSRAVPSGWPEEQPWSLHTGATAGPPGKGSGVPAQSKEARDARHLRTVPRQGDTLTCPSGDSATQTGTSGGGVIGRRKAGLARSLSHSSWGGGQQAGGHRRPGSPGFTPRALTGWAAALRSRHPPRPSAGAPLHGAPSLPGATLGHAPPEPLVTLSPCHAAWGATL